MNLYFVTRKKDEGKISSDSKIKKESKIEIDNEIEILQATDTEKGILRNLLDQSIFFEDENLFINNYYVIEKKYITNNKVEKDAPFIKLEEMPENGLVSFLSSNFFQGIGNIQSESLVKNYGFSFIRFLNNSAEKVSRDFQLSETSAKILSDGWKRTEKFNLLEIFFRDLNFKHSQIKSIKETIGSKIISSFTKEEK